MPGPRFPADGLHTVEQRGAVVDVHDIVGLDCHHAVVGHDREQPAGREALHEGLDQPVDLTQLHPPRGRAGTVEMPEQIHLAVVAVAESAVGDGRPHARGQITERLHADIAATAQDRASQAGTGELRAGDDAHRDACRGRPFEGRRHGLHLLGRRGVAKIVAPGVRAPPQGVDQTPTPGSRNERPTNPCSPERQPVPTAASPATVVDGNPACSVCPRSAAITGASSA